VVERDFSFFVDKTAPLGELQKTIQKASPLIENVVLFDIYSAKEGPVSVSFKVRLSSPVKTLEEAEIKSVYEMIIHHAQQIEGVQFRL